MLTRVWSDIGSEEDGLDGDVCREEEDRDLTVSRGGAQGARASLRAGVGGDVERKELLLRRTRRQGEEEGGAEEWVHCAAGAAGGEVRTTMGLVAELQELRDMYSRFLAMDEDARVAYVKERCHQKAPIASPFSLSPEGVGNFYEAMELVRRIAEAILLCRCFGVNEDVGKGITIGATTGAAANFMHNAFTDAAASDGNGFRIHRALFAFLRSYLPPMAAREWRRMRAQFV